MTRLPPHVAKGLNLDKEERCGEYNGVAECLYPAGECPIHDDVPIGPVDLSERPPRTEAERDSEDEDA